MPSDTPPERLDIGLLLFPNMTQLDMTGPYEVFAAIPGAKVHVLWKTIEPVTTDRGLRMLPTTAFGECPKLDVVCVPGGPGQTALMQDQEVLGFLKAQAEHCAWVTSVCTGSLLLGAAGLLRGYRATTHWLSLDLLALLGAEPIAERIVIDRNRVTGAGVTSGIDFALFLTAKLRGDAVARAIQLMIEYDPAPPFGSGSPKTADPALVASLAGRARPRQEAREAATRAAAQALGIG
jgi:cyclohexyl-isocyanide hydratase